MDWLGPTWIEINLNGLLTNLNMIRRSTNAKICAVLKGDAYGHGAQVTSQFLEKQKISFIAVNDVAEAIEIRTVNVQSPILVLSPPLPQQVSQIFDLNLTPTVSCAELIESLAKEGVKRNRKLRIHLKIDTGMGRIGSSLEETKLLIKLIRSFEYLELESIFTHFSSAFNDLAFTRRQLELLLSLKKQITQPNELLWHCANSAAFLTLPESHLDMVRIGTLLYGQTPVKLPKNMQLKQTWELFSRIIQVRQVTRGTTVGYDKTYTTKRTSIIGVLPLGYGDGLGVAPSRENHWQHIKNTILNVIDSPRKVIIDNKTFPIVGKVAMGMCCVDLTDHPNAKHLYGAIVSIPSKRVTMNRRIPKAYQWNNKILLISWNNKLFVPKTTNQGIYMQEIPSKLAKEIY